MKGSKTAMKLNLIPTTLVVALTMTATLASTNALAADTTGTLTVTGNVASKCTVISGGTTGSLAFGSNFGGATELSDSSGHLISNFGAFTSSGTGDFQINCNKANPSITLAATSMTTSAAAPTGYANTISYKAFADIAAISAANATSTVTRSTDSGASTGPTGLGNGLYVQNTSNNVVIRANSFSTTAPSDVLVAGAYSGTITVTLTPS